MIKIFYLLLLFVSTTAHAQLNNILDFKTYTADATFLFISDTLQGGFFKRYIGPDQADGGMVFTDGKGRKWLRHTEDSKIKIRWYGLKPKANYGPPPQSGSDDAVIIRKAIKYIENHQPEYNTLKMESCRFNEWYLIASTIYLNGITLEGEGVNKRPTTLFQVANDVTAFRIPAGGGYVSVKNVAVRHYRDFVKGTDSNNHSFDIHTVVDFENVTVMENPNGDGFHVDACGYADKSDTIKFGNADQSRFTNCFADMCMNGFWINGCDANVISFNDCSASSNIRWGVYDNGLLGNKYWNLHLANNGKTSDTKQTGVRVKRPPYSDTSYRTYFLRADVGKQSIGKRPDRFPDLWYQNSTGLGGNTWWDSTKQYYSGGGVWAANPNANNLFIGTYTESYSPANIISARSNWIEGLNGADIIGGMFEHTFGGYKFFTGAGIQSPIVATSTLRLQAPNGTAEVDITTNSTSSLSFKLPSKSGTLALAGDVVASDNSGYWIFPIGDQTSNITAGANKFSFRLPFGCTITDVRISTTTSSSSGPLLFDINANGSSILSRKVSIDAGEKTSLTAEVQPQIESKNLPDDAVITVDVQAAGLGVKGVKVIFYYKKLLQASN